MFGRTDGAHEAGTVSGLGGTKGRMDRGRSRWLADLINAAVVNVIANETAKRSCKAVWGWG